MSEFCETIQWAAQPVLSIRTVCPVQDLPQVLGESYGIIGQYLAELGEQPAGEPYVAYFNMDMAALDMEIGFPVSKVLPGKDRVQANLLPQGPAACLLYTGPYAGMEKPYAELNAYIQENQLKPTGVVYEFYLNDPSITPPEELKTRIVFPLIG